MTVCSVKECHSTSGKQNKCGQITFHNFPVDSVVANRWIQIIRRNRKEDSWKPSKNTKICSMHFRDEDIYSTKKDMRRIRRGAVPIKRLFLPSSESDSENEENSEKSHELLVKTISTQTERCPESRPQSTSSRQQSVTTVFIPDSVKADQNYTAKQIEKTLLNKPEPDIYSSDSDYIFETPQKQKLRRDLRRKSLLQIKHARLIKTLKQKNRRLKKRNASLKQIVSTV